MKRAIPALAVALILALLGTALGVAMWWSVAGGPITATEVRPEELDDEIVNGFAAAALEGDRLRMMRWGRPGE
jgi:hypothetical protein